MKRTLYKLPNFPKGMRHPSGLYINDTLRSQSIFHPDWTRSDSPSWVAVPLITFASFKVMVGVFGLLYRFPCLVKMQYTGWGKERLWKCHPLLVSNHWIIFTHVTHVTKKRLQNKQKYRNAFGPTYWFPCFPAHTFLLRLLVERISELSFQIPFWLHGPGPPGLDESNSIHDFPMVEPRPKPCHVSMTRIHPCEWPKIEKNLEFQRSSSPTILLDSIAREPAPRHVASYQINPHDSILYILKHRLSMSQHATHLKVWSTKLHWPLEAFVQGSTNLPETRKASWTNTNDFPRI